MILYTKEDYLELKLWFKANENSFPEMMQIDECTYSPNLKNTVLMILEQIDNVYSENTNIQGSYQILLKIKQKLEENTKRE